MTTAKELAERANLVAKLKDLARKHNEDHPERDPVDPNNAGHLAALLDGPIDLSNVYPMDSDDWIGFVEEAVVRLWLHEYGVVLDRNYVLPALLEKYPDETISPS